MACQVSLFLSLEALPILELTTLFAVFLADPTTPSRRAVPESSASGRKLHKERRGSNASARRSVDLAAEDGGERKEGGFWSKAFGKSSTSSVDEQRR